MKDALHGESQVQIVAIDGSWVLSSIGWGNLLSSGENGFIALSRSTSRAVIARRAGRKGLIATRRTDPADDLFTAELLPDRRLLCGDRRRMGFDCRARADLIGQCGGGEAVGLRLTE